MKFSRASDGKTRNLELLWEKSGRYIRAVLYEWCTATCPTVPPARAPRYSCGEQEKAGALQGKNGRP